jgi:hypothetical protein
MERSQVLDTMGQLKLYGARGDPPLVRGCPERGL